MNKTMYLKKFKVYIVMYQEWVDTIVDNGEKVFEQWPRIAGVYPNYIDAFIKVCKLFERQLTDEDHVYILKKTVQGVNRYTNNHLLRDETYDSENSKDRDTQSCKAVAHEICRKLPLVNPNFRQ